MSDAWITLRTFDSLPMAELARVRLDEAGVPCRILNAEVVSMYPLWGNAVGYIQLQVPEEQLETAADLLVPGPTSEELPSGDCAMCGEPLDDDGPCPMCGYDPEAGEDATPSADQTLHETMADDDASDEHVPTAVSLDGMRGFGRSMISAYLIAILLSFVLTGLMLAAALAEYVFHGPRGF